MKVDRVGLAKLINSHFALIEIYALCFRLNIDFENLPGARKTEKVKELIRYMERHGRLEELVEAVRKERPDLQISYPLEQELTYLPNSSVPFLLNLINWITIIAALFATATTVFLLARIFTPASSSTDLSPLEISSAEAPHPEDIFSELTVTYPSYMRPNSSERIDLTLRIPPALASLQPIQLERLPSTVTPTLRTLDSHFTYILASEQMAAALTSPTFDIERIYPEQQQILPDGDPTLWAWNITSPTSISTGLVTLKLYKLYEEDTDLESLAPTWTGTIHIEVVENTPTPAPPPTSTPSLINRATDSLASNTALVLGSCLTLLGVIISAILGPSLVDRWRNRSKGDRPKDVTKMLQGPALKEIRKSNDINQLKIWLVDEQHSQKRSTILNALQARMAQLEEQQSDE